MAFARTLVALAFAAAAAGSVSAQTVIGGGKGAPSFPITINQPGSYKLGANLTVADPTVSAIVVTAPNVTIDLAGFTIAGPNTCSSYNKTCTVNTGEAMGIYSTAENTRVVNGVVSGFTWVGVNLYAKGGSIENVRVRHNRLAGIGVNDGSIRGVVAELNGAGILANNGLIRDSFVHENLSNGVQLGGGLLIGSVVSGNGALGLQMANGMAAFRETVFLYNGTGAAAAGSTSLGNNFCNSMPC